ncbi:MAG: response regulator transcription factor [Nitrospira sp.]
MMKEEKATQIVIVDDHTLVRQEIRSLLEGYPDIDVVGEARNGLEAIFMVEKFRPHVILMDINMPKMNGIEATAQISKGYPDTIIIGFSVNTTTENQEAMKRAGAVQLVAKDAAVEELCEAIREAVTNRETSQSSAPNEQTAG